MKTIFAYFTLMLVGVFNAQNTSDIKSDKELYYLYYKSTSGADEIVSAGERMLKLAKTDKEKAKAYYRLGDGYIKMGNYSKSIYYSKKADSLFEKIDYKSVDHFMANYLLAIAYKRSGMVHQADKKLAKAHEIASQIKNSRYENIILFIETDFLEEEKKYCEAIPNRKKIIQSIQSKYKKEHDRIDRVQEAICRSYLALDYLLCNDLENAKIQIEKYEESQYKYHFAHYRIEIYFLSKAIILAKEGDVELSKFFFDKAKEAAQKTKNRSIQTIITEQRLESQIDDVEGKHQLFHEFLDLKDKTKEETIKAIAEETNRQNKTILRHHNYKKLWIILACILVVTILFYAYFSYRKNKKLKLRFEKIISDLEKNNIQKEEVKVEKTIKTTTQLPQDNKPKIMSPEKETELLKKIEDFEKGTDFTAKNFTLNNLSSILVTNQKYINYLIKEHKGKNFNDYINGLKIKFVVELLYNNPEALKYKINYLSEISGFSSHSHFTKIFTKEVEISPSAFISNLKKHNSENYK